MFRSTRSRRAESESDTKVANAKTNAKRIVAAKPTAKKNEKTRSSARKISEQDENAVPLVKIDKIPLAKNSQSTTLLGSKLHPVSNSNSLLREKTVLKMKSPVLRDRTNATNESVKLDKSSTKLSNLQSKENKKTKAKSTAKKNNVKLNKLQISLDRYTVKQAINTKTQLNQNTRKGDTELLDNQDLEKRQLKNLPLEKNVDITHNENVAKETKLKGKNKDNLLDLYKCESKNVKLNSNRVLRRQNMSSEDVEKLLNQDDEISETESDNLDNSSKSKSIEGTDSSKKKVNDAEKVISNKNSQSESSQAEPRKKGIINQGKQIIKKFFKNKDLVNPVDVSKKTVRPQVNSRKKTTRVAKIQNNDSTFSPKQEIEHKSEVVEKKLRPRNTKNYCELSRRSQNSTPNSEQQKGKENLVTEEVHKVGPIYKSVKLSLDNVKDKEEVYEFPNESQDNDQKIKKRKRTVKKPAVKRLKKATTSRPIKSQQTQKKPIKTTNTESVEKKNKISGIDITKPVILKNVQFANQECPETIGNSTFQEASTIKILSDEKLEGSGKINLTTTPAAPKTISSELKLYGPKNAITLEPKQQYNNMINHSLIRQSMSPIKKVSENFDTGSPWRPIDAFSRVKKIVQSTPQINRLPITRDKKPLVPAMKNLNTKSISSEDTIHISSSIEDKQSHSNNDMEVNSQTKENKLSPRKFGTVLSNLSPAKSSIVNNARHKTSQENNQPSIETILLESTIPSTSVEQENNLKHPVIDNKENTVLTSNKSPAKKIITPSPFRFDKLRPSAKCASPSSKTPKSNLLKENETAIAGPSTLEKPSSTLRQSNLNNFLNLDEMPESTRISTTHGIFDDIHSTPINGRKSKKLIEEANVENAFGFDEDEDEDGSEITPVENKATSTIATEKDVKESVKGKVFLKARVKSNAPTRISDNTVKKTLLKDVLKKQKPEEKKLVNPPERNEKEVNKENKEVSSSDQETSEDENTINNNVESKKEYQPLKALSDATSFSDTFDVLSENGDADRKVPDEIPLFVDLEPVHFTQPPRRSYLKRKRAVHFDAGKYNESDEESHDKPKPKKKKESKLSKEEEKRLREWVENVNKTFDEIEHYDLVVE